MNVRITPSHLNGITRAPMSKSYAHRALICAALADAPTQIVCPEPSEDILITAQCLKRLGARIEYKNETFEVVPVCEKIRQTELFCGQSGSTLRFLMPVAAALGTTVRFDGEGRLPLRPIGQMCTLLEKNGVKCSAESLPLTVEGKLRSGNYALNGNVSSQFISGLMMASPLTDGKCNIITDSRPASMPYIRMTGEMMKLFGAEAVINDTVVTVERGNYRTPGRLITQGDWSGAAFFLCAGALSEAGVCVTGLSVKSTQGDKEIVNIIRSFGAEVTQSEEGITVRKNECRPIMVDAEDIPDIIPVAAVLACFACGESAFYNAGRLRIKESDRMQATVELITGLGGKAYADGDTLRVYGTGKLCGGEVNTYADHRMVMAGSVAAAYADGEVLIRNSEAVAKSFPNFFEEFKRLHGIVTAE